MYRAIPTANKILTTKWQNQEHSIHKQNLKNIKPSVDMSEPPRFKHLMKKMKKTQLLEGKRSPPPIFITVPETYLLYAERYTEIERENRILLEKMTSILQKQRGNLNTANSAGPVVGAAFGPNQSQINNNQRSGVMNSTTGAPQGVPAQSNAHEVMTIQPSIQTGLGNRKSLNREARKKELMKITKEN